MCASLCVCARLCVCASCPLIACVCQTEGLEGALDKTVQQLREPALVKRSADGPGEDPVLRISVYLSQELPGWNPPSQVEYDKQLQNESEGCCVVL